MDKIHPQILIKTPLTSNGSDVLIGPDGKIQYREDLADARAKPDFEKINTKLPNNLKMIIENYDEKKAAPQPVIEEEEETEQPDFSKAIKKTSNKKANA